MTNYSRLAVAALALVLFTQGAAARIALVFDTTNSHVLYAEDLDAPWYPASLTKMMTAYLAFVAIRDNLAWGREHGCWGRSSGGLAQ